MPEQSGAETSQKNSGTSGEPEVTEEGDNDSLDAVLNLEQGFVEVGLAEGARYGEAKGAEDGFSAGYSAGHGLGEEIGAYKGAALVWTETLAGNMTESTRGAINRLVLWIDALANMKPETDEYHDTLVKIRSTYRMITVNLRMPGMGTDELGASSGLDF